MQITLMTCTVGLTFDSFSVEIYSRPRLCYSNIRALVIIMGDGLNVTAR